MAARSPSAPLAPPRDEQPPERPYLTALGRQLLAERFRVLAQTVSELHDALEGAPHRHEVVDAHRRASRELARLHRVLRDAGSVEHVPDDPNAVELGDRVVIRLPDRSTRTYLIVDSAEAPLDDARISATSPLGRVLLGRHVGQEVEVDGTDGSYRCTILHATRG